MKKILKVMGLFFKKTHMKILCVVISLVLLASGVFFFENSLGRLVESCRDISTSFVYAIVSLFKLDVEYVNNVTLINDVKIMFKTAIAVLNHSGISSETSDTMEAFTGTHSEKEF